MDAAPRARNLLDYWGVLKRRRGVIYLSIAAVLLTTLIGSFLVTPLYRSTVTAQIERQNPEILNVRALASTDYSWSAYADFYQTQYKLLSSDVVMRKTVERLGLVSHPRFAAVDSAPSLYGRLRRLFPGTIAKLPTDPVEIAATRLLAGLEISPVRNSHLVLVSWVSPDPVLAAEVANSVVDSYIAFSLESGYQTSDQASEFLVDQVASLKREIAVLETKLQGYGESKRIVSADDEGNITMQALSDIAAKRTQARTVLAAKEAAYHAAVSTPAAALPEVQRSELIARLKQEYATYEAEYSEKSKLFKDEWPGMQQLRSKMEQAKTRLDLEIEETGANVRLAAESEYRQASLEVRGLSALLDDQQGAAQTLKRDAVEFKNLQSDVQKRRETLNALLTRQNEMALTTRLKDMDATSSNIRVVDRARPATAPFRPNKKLNLLLGLIVGVGIGIGAAFFLDSIDNTIASPAEISRLVGLPVLAVVPHHGAATGRSARRQEPALAETVELVAHRDRSAPTSEAYRELRTAILLSNPGHPPRQIMVTSALPEDGKSSTAMNLAVVLAQSGRRVLLVDADLRRPRLHKVFGIDSARGLSVYLSGLEVDPLSLAQRTAIDGLDVVVSGPVPPDPSELLNSTTFATMGPQFLAGGYDHIVYDSPPALAVADPVIISSVVEATIIVAREGRTPRESLQRAVAKFIQAGTRPIGIVLNDLDAGRHGYGTYGYYGRAENRTALG
jgi:capsular exopolysaccharide synthesis family protein